MDIYEHNRNLKAEWGRFYINLRILSEGMGYKVGINCIFYSFYLQKDIKHK